LRRERSRRNIAGKANTSRGTPDDQPRKKKKMLAENAGYKKRGTIIKKIEHKNGRRGGEYTESSETEVYDSLKRGKIEGLDFELIGFRGNCSDAGGKGCGRHFWDEKNTRTILRRQRICMETARNAQKRGGGGIIGES